MCQTTTILPRYNNATRKPTHWSSRICTHTDRFTWSRKCYVWHSQRKGLYYSPVHVQNNEWDSKWFRISANESTRRAVSHYLVNCVLCWWSFVITCQAQASPRCGEDRYTTNTYPTVAWVYSDNSDTVWYPCDNIFLEGSIVHIRTMLTAIILCTKHAFLSAIDRGV